MHCTMEKLMVIKCGGSPLKCISLILTGYILMDQSPAICLCTIINGDSRCIWSIPPCMELALWFYARMDSLQRKNYHAKRERKWAKSLCCSNSERTAKCTVNYGSWPWAIASLYISSVKCMKILCLME